MNNGQNEKRPAQRRNDQSAKNIGFVDDLANDTIRSPKTIRNNNGGIVYSNPLENEKKPRRKVTKMSRARYRRQNTAFTVIAIFLSIITIMSIVLIVKTSGKKPVGSADREIENSENLDIELSPVQNQGETSPAETSSDNKNSPASFSTVTVNNSEMREGDLILVNYKYEYKFPSEDILVSMYDKNSVYSVSTTETYLQKSALDAFKLLAGELFENSGCDDVIVVSAFRSIEKQQAIYQDRLDRFGSEYAAAYVADPGYSEHHTGLAMDLSIYTEDGLTYDIEDYSESKWFIENYDRYGYVLRYPEEKAGITSINYEGWHYRYVGLPHSVIMDKLNFCLEEYIDYLRDYTVDAKVLKYTENGSILSDAGFKDDFSAGDTIIFFYPASDGETTEIPVPDDMTCAISGNNVDGFIVTASK